MGKNCERPACYEGCAPRCCDEEVYDEKTNSCVPHADCPRPKFHPNYTDPDLTTIFERKTSAVSATTMKQPKVFKTEVDCYVIPSQSKRINVNTILRKQDVKKVVQTLYQEIFTQEMSQNYITEFRVDRFSENGQIDGFQQIQQEFQQQVQEYEEYHEIQTGSFEFNVHQAQEFDCNARAEITFVNSDECQKLKDKGLYPGMCDSDVDEECVLDLSDDSGELPGFAGKARNCGDFVRSGTTTIKAVTTEQEGINDEKTDMTSFSEENPTTEPKFTKSTTLKVDISDETTEFEEGGTTEELTTTTIKSIRIT